MNCEIDNQGLLCLKVQTVDTRIIEFIDYLKNEKRKELGKFASEIINSYGNTFFRSFFPTKAIELVIIPGWDKSKKGVLTFEEIIKKAKKNGYQQTFPEVALILGAELNQDDIQRMGCSKLVIVHNFFRTKDGLLNLLSTDGMKVSAELADERNENYPKNWSMLTGFVFQKP